MENTDGILLWTKEQVADQFGVCTKTVSRLIEDGHLPFVRIGRNIRIRTKAIHHFLEQQEEYNGPGTELQLSDTGDSLCNSISETVSTRLPTSQQVENRLDALLKPVTNE